MEINQFIENYREAFGIKPELPIAIWYSETPAAITPKIGGCMFKVMPEIRAGATISLNADTIGCGGGKFYTGFSPMPEHVPTFVSIKERYKETPQMVVDFLEHLQVPKASGHFLNFARIDRLKDFGHIDGLLFLATPDILSGLTTWAFFDNNADSTVQTTFGSGCCEIVTRTVLENKKGGQRTFIGLLDPSARPYFGADMLSYTIPMSRFKTMYDTMRQSCLFDTHAWSKVRERINQ